MFNFAIVCYLFLGGLGGGLCAVAGASGLSIPREELERQSTAKNFDFLGTAFAVAALSLVLAGLLLLSDAGITPALKYLFFVSKLSYLSVGAWAIILAVGLCSVLACMWKMGRAGRNIVLTRVLFASASLVGFVAALYTGLFLASMKAVPLWNTPWLTALFVFSSLSCGVVTFAVLSKMYGVSGVFPSHMRMLVGIDLGLIVLELLSAIALVLTLLGSPTDGPTAAMGVASILDVMTGQNSWIWWGGFVGFGLIVTAVFDVLILRTGRGLPGQSWSVLGILFCVLAGAFSLRYCIIVAGAHPVLGF
ncbi:MAG: NrfD/PsrC family molybdoenzyme membrane anchor subunit [Raoultibacter sp.]